MLISSPVRGFAVGENERESGGEGMAYSSIWDFLRPVAGSFMGILMISLGEAITMERIAEYWEHISLSSTVQ